MSAGDVRTHAFSSRGHTYSFQFQETELHASWWSFQDEQIVRDRHWHPSPGDVVLDVGAAFGSYALPALAMGARVMAFSPADFDTRLLRRNLELNPELSRRCLVLRDGLHQANGWFDPDHNVYSQMPARDACDHDSAQWLRVRALDSVLAERPGVDRVDLVKLDVEGAELGVLRGAEKVLRRHRPRLLIELHEFHKNNADVAARVDEYLRGLDVGYRSVLGPVKHCAVSHVFYEGS